MAEFCKQCSIELFGKDEKDLANLSTKEDTDKGEYALVICEDCGATLVNHEGECVLKDCFKKHGTK